MSAHPLLHSLQAKFKAAKQEHVFQFLDKLSETEIAQLCEDLKDVDPEEVNAIYHRTTTTPVSQANMNPFPTVINYEGTADERKGWEKLGFQKINEGKVAVLLLAGGQGTRLGTTNPKGMYNVGLLSGKSLFQLQAERLLKVQQLATASANSSKASVVPWYIMTSESTSEITQQFFERQNFFGLQKENVFFFEQGMLPCITPQGKILMETPTKVSRAPNGNGGIYSSLVQSGVLADMEKRGIEMVYIYGVDNILIKMADPIFVGFCFDKEIDCSPKVVAKAYAEEPVGVVCLNKGKPGVIEYSEIDKTRRSLTDPKTGKLVYNEAHVCMNMFSLEFLKKVTSSKLNLLPYHIAQKKIPAVDEHGKTVTPTNINGWKLELFIFDVFEFAENMASFEVLRNEEFSPLKNGPDVAADSPVSCVKHITQLHKSYIEKAGGIITNKEDESLRCEVSPLVSYSGEGLEKHVKGKSITLPYLLQ